MARRLLRCAASLLSDAQTTRALNAADTAPQIQAAMSRYGSAYPDLQRLADVVVQQVNTPQVWVLEGQKLPRMYLAHHELESVPTNFVYRFVLRLAC